MAYSAEFIAKISQKPQYLTPSEKARTFATMRGWEYRHPQADNEKFKDMPSELIVAIPGLSMLLDVKTTDTSFQTISTGNPDPVVLTRDSAGFTRRSRRRYSINVSFPEQIFLISGGSVNFRLDVQYVTQLSTAGATLGLTDGVILTPITNTSTEKLAIGRVQFDIPTFSADPEHLDVKIVKFFVEADDDTMTTSSLEDDRGRKLGSTDLWQKAAQLTGHDSAKFPASPPHNKELENYVMEIVKPSTTDPR